MARTHACRHVCYTMWHFPDAMPWLSVPNHHKHGSTREARKDACLFTMYGSRWMPIHLANAESQQRQHAFLGIPCSLLHRLEVAGACVPCLTTQQHMLSCGRHVKGAKMQSLQPDTSIQQGLCIEYTPTHDKEETCGPSFNPQTTCEVEGVVDVRHERHMPTHCPSLSSRSSPPQHLCCELHLAAYFRLSPDLGGVPVKACMPGCVWLCLAVCHSVAVADGRLTSTSSLPAGLYA